MQAPYRTVSAPAGTTAVIQKSRFLSYCYPVKCEEEAQAHIKALRALHPQATHHCYAYILGANMGLMRYSDDGEPQGTAGQPILQVIQQKQVVDVLVVVVRYFGGVLLGAGGLVRAYAGGCADVLNQAEIIQMEPTCQLLFDCPYPLWDKCKHFLDSQNGILIDSANFGVCVSLTLLIKQKKAEDFLRQLNDLMNETVPVLLSDPFAHHWTVRDGDAS